MSRITKRYLLHSMKENDEIKDSDLDELKLNFHSMKLELGDNMLQIKETLVKYSSLLFNGLGLLGEYFHRNANNSARDSRLDLNYKNFRSLEIKFQLGDQSQCNADKKTKI